MRSFTLFLVLLLPGIAALSQSRHNARCGYDYVQEVFKRAGVRPAASKAQGKASGTTYTIPVVFHIVLNRTQMEKLGGEQGIRDYIDSQLAYVNRDFNCLNGDSSAIPAAFRPMWGQAGISFALAHRRPDGAGTEGYELIMSDKKGINIDGNQGSGTAFSDAKYTEAGGADAWDVNSYLNIWVVNMMEDNVSSDYVGITMAPNTTKNTPFEPEIGIVLNYRVWQVAFKGRILTHELGHYFSLKHTWGDNAECPGMGDNDDGVADTPPQADANYYTCPTYPEYDGCTAGGEGLMFMNYMDYTDEGCQTMFTEGQVELMRADLLPQGVSYPLTTKPEVLEWPTQDPGNTFSIYPVPAKGILNLYFPAGSKDLSSLSIINVAGKVVASHTVAKQDRFYSFDLSGLQGGFYFIRLYFSNETVVRKIVLQ